jgi:pentatricopeptide repeat protein
MMDQVKKLYNEMKEKGVYLDQIAYTTIVAFCSTGEMILARSFFDEMLREGYSPNVILYTCMINGYWKINMIDRAKKLYDEMKENGVYPDRIAYTTLIAAFCNTGEMIMAHTLFDEMLREGYSPNASTYARMVNGYWKLNMIDQAQKAAIGLSRKVLRLKSGAIR